MNHETAQIVPTWVLLGASIFAFVAIADLPYVYYRLLRWTTCGVSIASAMQLYRISRIGWVWALGTLAVLFNPLIPLYFERHTWKMLDGVAGCLFLAVFLLTRKHNEEANRVPGFD
jgi:hypothetical protein